MENRTPTAVARYTIIKGRVCARLDAEGARYGIGRMVDLLLLELLTWMIAWCVNRDEQRAQQAACQSDIVSEDEVLLKDKVARRPPGGFAVAAGAPVIDTPVIGGGTDDDCRRDEHGVASGCEREPRERRHVAANLATMGRGVAGLDYGCRVLERRFAKIESRGWVESCRFRSGLATMAD